MNLVLTSVRKHTHTHTHIWVCVSLCKYVPVKMLHWDTVCETVGGERLEYQDLYYYIF